VPAKFGLILNLKPGPESLSDEWLGKQMHNPAHSLHSTTSKRADFSLQTGSLSSVVAFWVVCPGIVSAFRLSLTVAAVRRPKRDVRGL